MEVFKLLHYVSLLRESVIGGAELWIVKDFIKQHNEPHLIPDLAGLAREIQHDNLDYERIVAYFTELKWGLLEQLSRPVDSADDDAPQIKPVTSSGIVSWTIIEFLQMRSGALTGIFFSIDGTFRRIQKYFLDVTKLN